MKRILAPRDHALSTLANRPRGHFSVWVRLFPIIFFISYLSLTVFLFMFGPWAWPVRDGTKLYIFLALAHSALFFGYFTAAFREPWRYSQQWSVHKLVVWTVIVNVIVLFPTAAFRTGSLLPDVGQGLADPGAAYSHSLLLRDSGTPVVEYFRLLVGPFTAMLLPFAVFYWRCLGLVTRIAAVAALLGNIALFIAMGTNKAIADTVLCFPWLVFAAHGAGISRISWRRLVPLMFSGAACLVGFLLFFTTSMMTRTGSAASVGYFPAINIYADRGNFLVKTLPTDLRVGAFGLDSYLTQGYYALYLALDEPFVPMFGVGNSMFLTRQADRIAAHSEVWKLSYPARIEKYGWDSVGLWSSIYTWIASDVSFPGTLLVIFLIGRLFALSWLDTLNGSNPFAVALFAQLVIMLFYFPANNQLLQSGEGLTGLVGTLALWAYTRCRYPRRLAAELPK